MKVKCISEGCNRTAEVKGLCRHHYNQMRQLGRYGSGEQCQERGCQMKNVARGYCSRHYQAKRRAGEMPVRTCSEECWMEAKPGSDRCEMHVGWGSCKECTSPILAKGLCSAHYQKARREKRKSEQTGVEW